MKENNNKFLIVLIVLSITLLGLVTYIVCDKLVLSRDNNIGKESNEVSKTEDNKKELIYACSTIMKDEEGGGTLLDVPCIAVNNENAKKINAQIYKDVYEHRVFLDNSFKYYINGDIISLVISYSGFMGAGSGNDYDVYNFNKNNYDLVSNEDILNSLNLKSSDFVSNYNKVIKTSFDKEMKEFEEKGGYENVKDMASFVEANSINDIKLYINNKKIYAYASVGIGVSSAIDKFIIMN